jgi:hypothetical protein
MTTNRRLPADRDRAIARLRRVTLGTAAGGLVGTMLFGALAAATYDGTTQVSTAADSGQVAANDDSTTNSSTTTPDDSSSTTTDDSTNLQAAQAPTSSSSSGAAHASTGGS